MNLITRLTRNCQRQDCQISYGGSSTTLMGFMPTYDKRGKPIGRDPNTTTSDYQCSTCGKRWQVKSRDGEKDEISESVPKKQETQT